MTKILIVPGLFGSDEGHWQHFWLDDVPQSRLVRQDDWNHARLDRWMERLERHCWKLERPISLPIASAAS